MPKLLGETMHIARQYSDLPVFRFTAALEALSHRSLFNPTAPYYRCVEEGANHIRGPGQSSRGLLGQHASYRSFIMLVKTAF